MADLEVLSTQENQTVFFMYLKKIFMDETGAMSHHSDKVVLVSIMS